MFSKVNTEQNIVSAIDGATALKLDESYEIKNREDQSALIDSFESDEEDRIKEEALLNQNNGEIPTGVSIESASYMENNNENMDYKTISQNNDHLAPTNEEEYTPKLFSDDQPQEDLEQREEKESHTSERLFDQDTSEDEDFEIPAFLRRQKF